MELLNRARYGDLQGVKRLIQQGIDINTTNTSNQTALYTACEKGHTEVALYLLDSGASVNLGANPLITAVRNNHYDCVKLLLEHHANANCANSLRESPISISISKHQYSIILLLLQYDATPLDFFNGEPLASLGGIIVQLLKHAKAEHAKAIQRLMNFAFWHGLGELVEKISSNYSYAKLELCPGAAYYSAKNNWPNILSKLLEKRVDINALTNGQTPLCAACVNGHEYIVTLLLDNGADPDVADNSGRTAAFCSQLRSQVHRPNRAIWA